MSPISVASCKDGSSKHEEALKAIVMGIAKGEESAMKSFYDLLQDQTYRFIRTKLNDSFAAADILNETMLEVWRSASRFEGRSKVTTWLFSIAYHKVIDYLRKQKRHEAEELTVVHEEGDDPGYVELVGQVDLQQQIQHCLQKLSDKHRSVVHLLFYEEMTYPEIAEVMGCPLGTVKTRIFHAKEALKKCLTVIA